MMMLLIVFLKKVKNLCHRAPDAFPAALHDSF